MQALQLFFIWNKSLAQPIKSILKELNNLNKGNLLIINKGDRLKIE